MADSEKARVIAADSGRSYDTKVAVAVMERRLTAVANFRDPCAIINDMDGNNGRKLRERKIYRSARPDAATPEDRALLTQEYGITTIIDLRTKSEHMKQAERLGAQFSANGLFTSNKDMATVLKIPGVRYKEVNFHGGWFELQMLWRLSWLSFLSLCYLIICGRRMEAISIVGKEVMATRGLVGLAEDSIDYCGAAIKQVFETIAVPSNLPVLIHCTQGKDRTGMVVALILMSIGVPIASITQDYVISERELMPQLAERIAEIREVGLPDEFAWAPSDWVEKIHEYIVGKFGSVEQYLDSIGVSEDVRSDVQKALLVRDT